MRYRDGQATVNLLLNRASPWIDVDSYLPYEGRVQLKNKTANSVAVRIPGWAKIEAVTCTVGVGQARPRRTGRYLTFESLRQGDEIELKFGMPDGQAEYLINYQPYKVSFRGSTVVDVGPRKESDLFYPLYRRAHMTKGPAPMMKRQRFVSNMTEFSEAD